MRHKESICLRDSKGNGTEKNKVLQATETKMEAISTQDETPTMGKRERALVCCTTSHMAARMKTVFFENVRWRKQRAFKREIDRRQRERERLKEEKERRYERMLRQQHREKLREEYRRELKFERKRESAYNLLNKLIGSVFGHKHREGHGVDGEETIALRRRLGEAEDDDDEGDMVQVDMLSRCQIFADESGNYEFCVNYNVGDKFISFDIKMIDKVVLKDANVNRLDYRMNANDVALDEDFIGMELKYNGRYRMFDAVEGTLGYAVWKYELLDWHKFGDSDMVPYEYGDFSEFDEYVHYFHEYELYFNIDDFIEYDGADQSNGEYVECSTGFDYLMVRMCMKEIVNEEGQIDLMLYFENDANDGGAIKKPFGDYVFYFDDGENWDEISMVNGKKGSQWIKKCSFRLMIAKLCIEQFHENDSRASIKLQSKNKYLLRE